MLYQLNRYNLDQINTKYIERISFEDKHSSGLTNTCDDVWHKTEYIIKIEMISGKEIKLRYDDEERANHSYAHLISLIEEGI